MVHRLWGVRVWVWMWWHFRHDAWNVRVGSPWWAQPREPSQRGVWKQACPPPPPSGVAMDPSPVSLFCSIALSSLLCLWDIGRQPMGRRQLRPDFSHW